MASGGRTVRAVLVCVLALLMVMNGSQLFAQQSMVLVAAGSGLPETLYQGWNAEFGRTNMRTSVRYLPLGTEEGSRQALKGVADFAGGDYQVNVSATDAAHGGLVQIPVAAAGVAIVTNIPGVKQEINLTGPVLADIFLSKITTWNHPEIARLNPGVNLPAAGIMVLHRTDGKGANYIISDYLSHASPEFKAKIGRGLSPKWVTGMGLARGEDILFQVKDTDGAIGYVEMNLAMKGGVALAHIKNADGEFVRPSPESLAAAAAQAEVTDDLKGSLVTAEGKESYPIAGYTWIYLPEHAKDAARLGAVKTYVEWVLSSGQTMTSKLGFAPLPPAVVKKARSRLDSLKSATMTASTTSGR